MRGVITGRDVVRHSFTIVRLFGPRAYLQCLRAALGSTRTTFLETIFNHPHAAAPAVAPSLTSEPS